MPHTIRTERLVLRPATLRGARALWHQVRPFAVLRNTSLWPYPLSYAHAAFMIRNAGPTPEDPSRVFYIDEGGRVLGTIGLHRRSDRVFALGYMIGQEAWGRGVVTEAAQATCRFGFRQLRADRMIAEVYTDNPRSERVLTKLGFIRRPGFGIGYSTARQQHHPITTWDLVPENLAP